MSKTSAAEIHIYTFHEYFIHSSTSQVLSTALSSQAWQHLYVVTAIDWPQIAASALETWQLLWNRLSRWKGLKINHFPLDSATGSGKTRQNQSNGGIQEPTLFSLTFYPLSPRFLNTWNSSPCLWSGLQIFNLGSHWHCLWTEGFVWILIQKAKLGLSLSLHPARESDQPSRAPLTPLSALTGVEAKSPHGQARLAALLAPASEAHVFTWKMKLSGYFNSGRLLNRFHQGDLPHCFITW